MISEQCARFSAAGAEQLVLLLDASESAADCRPAIVSLVADLLAALPSRVERRLFFLGNARPYSAQGFASRAALWFEENRSRASLLAPVMETLSAETATRAPTHPLAGPATNPPTIVVIGSGRLYDLEDWQDSPLLRRALLVRLGDSLQAGPCPLEEIVPPAAAELARRLHDPIERVAIGGPGFMPTLWGHPGYRLAMAEGQASLAGERLQDWAVTLRFFAAEEGAVRAVVTRASGEQAMEPLAPAPPPAMTGPAGLLSPAERAMFRQAVRRLPLLCSLCGREHDWDTLRCRQGGDSILGRLLYPSLRDCPCGSFVLFQQEDDGIRFQVHPCAALALGPEAAALIEGQQATVCRYDPRRRTWMPTGDRLEPYHRLSGGAHVVVV